MIWNILGLFFDTLIADDKYSVVNRDNFNGINADVIISEKKKLFSEVLSASLEFRLNFEHFLKKDDAHSLCILEITDCEIRPLTNV